MTKMVCTNCEVEYRPSTNGVEVIEYASFGPYKFWEADEWECPGCKTKVITGFGYECLGRHDVNPEEFEAMIQNAWAAGRLRHDFKSVEQRAGSPPEPTEATA